MVSFGKRSRQPDGDGSENEKRILTLHNDDVNTFDHVIDVLCEICDHDAIQAEQCALITHYKGACQIKTGVIEELLSLQEHLTQEKLVVTID